MSIETAPETQQTTSNLRVSEFTPLPSPQDMIAEVPVDSRMAGVVGRGRDEIRAVHGRSRRPAPGDCGTLLHP